MRGFCRRTRSRPAPCPGGGIGRRSGFKIRRWLHCGGSSPPPGTNQYAWFSCVACPDTRKFPNWHLRQLVFSTALDTVEKPNRGAPGNSKGLMLPPKNFRRFGNKSRPISVYPHDKRIHV